MSARASCDRKTSPPEKLPLTVVRLLSLYLDTQKRLLTLQIAAPHGITVSSNVATVKGLVSTNEVAAFTAFLNQSNERF